ncbi:hypothetical protein [Sulfurimonas paralvinellae]|uniref:Uncharacterized protein n=1 Tax=Sulfurimonas paralvinellae TaxID=317658 RepID=A0A7M1B634_9BACT|nr:hypothetical protein [Sulfurimonas paralvinellae]QOP45187.1 hypothetical protein FM071_02335 [Sulfurimonas paralvinellae]
MLKLESELFKKTVIIYTLIFSLFIGFTFFVLLFFLESEAAFYVGAAISVVFVLLSLLFFLFLGRYFKNIAADMEALMEYTNAINEKEYTAEVKIMHFVEFLQLSVLLKNIAKRLHQKKKKS